MKSKFMRVITMMFVLIAMVSTMSITASATDTTEVVITDEQAAWLEKNILASNKSGISGTQPWIGQYLTTDPDKAAKENGTIVQLGTFSQGDVAGVYYLKDGKSLSDLSKKITSSMNNEKTSDKVSDITHGLGIEADTIGATAMLSGLMPIVSICLGILVTLITIGMTLFSVFDIAYLAFPVFRNRCEEKKTLGGMGVKKDSQGNSKLTFVSDDAEYAVQQGSVESGKSPWGIYFGRRVVSYIMLAICLFILLTGNISLITDIALKAVAGIMNVLTGLA